MTWQPGPLKHWLALNDTGVWGDDPSGQDDTVVLRSTDIHLDGGWIINNPAVRFLAPAEREAKLLRVGDLVVVKSSGSARHLGKTAIVTDEVASLKPCFANFVQRLRPKLTADSRYVWYVLNSKHASDEMAMLGNTTTGLRNLNGTIIGSVRFFGPPLEDQRMIANYLDRETALIDETIKKKIEFKVLLDERIDSLIQEHVGAIPTRRRLRHLAKLGTGHTPDRRNSEYWENCVVPWVTADDLSSRDNPFEILMDTRQKISALGVAKSAAVVHPRGTVMLCRTASVGLICRIGIPMATTQAFVTWSPGPELDSGFLMYALHSLRQEWMRLAFGSTHDTIYMPDLESVKIPYVPISEQIMISQKLDTSTSRLLEAKELLNRQCNILKERRQALITAAVTGELRIPGVAA